MSKVLVIAEHLDGKLNAATAKTVSAALALKPDSIDIVVLAADPAAVALLTTSLAAASTAPRTAATSAPVTGEPRLQTDGSAMQIDTPLDLPKGFDPVELLAPQLMSME